VKLNDADSLLKQDLFKLDIHDHVTFSN